MIAFTSATFGFTAPPADGLEPIIMMPGLIGSRLQAQLHDGPQPHFWCEKDSDGEWVQLWLSLEQVVPEQKDCLLDRLQLYFNETTGNYSDAHGVTLDSNVDFGDVGGISSLDPTFPSESGYFRTMIQSFTALGYEPGKNLHGAPYDWRKAPDGHATGLYPKLKALLEQTVAANGKPAHVITHSLGGPTALGFFNRQTDEWLAEHVASFAPISGVFGGSLKQVKAYVSGDTMGIPLVPTDYLRQAQVSAASGAFMMATTDTFAPSEVLVTTDERNYTSSEWLSFLDDLGHTQAAAITRHMDALGVNAQQQTAPRVRTHLITSHGVATARGYKFKGRFKPGYEEAATEVINGDGDGTVNLESLLLPLTKWGDNAGAPVDQFNVSGVDHFSMVSDPSVLAYLKTKVLGL